MTTPSPQPAGDHARRVLGRMDRLGEVLAGRGDAIALLGLGSVGRDLHRLDDHSDLDFFVVVDDGAKERYLASVDWLEAAAPVAFSFANTVDGRKALFDDDLYAEYAVFTVAELRDAHYPPGRLVWQRVDAPAGLDVPRRPVPRADTDPSYEVHEAMTNLFVGLHRELRGEGLSATRLVQVHAVDRVLHLAGLTADDGGAARQDPFAVERGVERRHRDLPLAAMVAGYGHNGRAARAVLAWLREHWPQHVDAALLGAVAALVAEVERREPARDLGPAGPQRARP